VNLDPSTAERYLRHAFAQMLAVAALVVHVLEEAYQHLGHMELAADALLADQPPAAAS
jgi:hypothetical protein